MPRVIGIDPGTVSVDLCGLDDGRVYFERSVSTTEALACPSVLLDLLRDAGPVDLVAGPSGYGLPLIAARDLVEADIRLACLSAGGETGGIGGLGALLRAMARSDLPVVLTPGVVHLPSVPEHRKVNRVDMGTADKVCAAALAVHEQARRRRCLAREVSLIVLELGGAFTAGLAVDEGRIVDGCGGTSGSIGVRAAGALDGEVAFLAQSVSKGLLFGGGVSAVAGTPEISIETLAADASPRGRVAWAAFLEGALKLVAALTVSVPSPFAIVLSGRGAQVERLRLELTDRLARVRPGTPVEALAGFATVAKHAAQGAALIADGLAGGASADVVEALGIRDARGTALDHLYVISPEAARLRLGIPFAPPA